MQDKKGKWDREERGKQVPSSIGLELDTIHAMDCLDGMRCLGDHVIDIIVTSPPYNIGKPYHTYHDLRPRNEYLSWLDDIAAESVRILKENGSFFLNLGSKPRDPWISLDVAGMFRKHYVLQNTIHWIKSVAIEKEDVGNYGKITGDIAVGHYQPVNSPKYLSQCQEYIFHFTNHGNVCLDKLSIGVKYQDKSNIGRWKAATSDRRERGNTWFIPYPTVRAHRPHPTTFPVKLPELCIRLHGYSPTTVVLDPFIGTGSTAVACRKLGIHYIGFEIDPAYRALALESLERRRA